MTVILDIARNDGDSNNHPTMIHYVSICGHQKICEHNWQSVNLSGGYPSILSSSVFAHSHWSVFKTWGMNPVLGCT